MPNRHDESVHQQPIDGSNETPASEECVSHPGPIHRRNSAPELRIPASNTFDLQTSQISIERRWSRSRPHSDPSGDMAGKQRPEAADSSWAIDHAALVNQHSPLSYHDEAEHSRGTSRQDSSSPASSATQRSRADTRRSADYDLTDVSQSPDIANARRGYGSWEFHQSVERRARTPLPHDSDWTYRTSRYDTRHWLNTALEAAKLEMFHTLTRTQDRDLPKMAAVNVAAAQRLVLANLQKQIISEVARLHSTRVDSPWELNVIETLTSQYCNAVRDYEYMRQHAYDHGNGDHKDLFYLMSTRQIPRLAMEESKLIPDHLLPQGPLPIAKDHDDPTLPGLPRSVANKAVQSHQFLARLGMASAGGLFVIVPILVMANVAGKTSSLVTTVVAMLAFAVGITFKTQMQAEQVLAATAAYAAVLVVFVGTSLADPPNV